MTSIVRYAAVRAAEWAGWIDYVDGNLVEDYCESQRIAGLPRFAGFLLTVLAGTINTGAIADLNEHFSRDFAAYGHRQDYIGRGRRKYCGRCWGGDFGPLSVKPISKS